MELAISGWSLHREIPKKTSLLDFPRIAAQEFGVKAIELNSPFFASTKPDYLATLKKKMADEGVVPINIAVDLGNIANPDDEQRAKDITALKEWFSVAKAVGSPSIRINAGWGEPVDEAMLKRVIASYKELVKEAEKTGIKMLIENHGGPSSDPDNILRFLKEVGSESFRTCPDFGNFADDIRYSALEKVAPYAFVVHAKTYDFDEEGNETKVDIGRCVKIIKDAGYDGYLSVEFEGPMDEHEGIKKSLELLKRYL